MIGADGIKGKIQTLLLDQSVFNLFVVGRRGAPGESGVKGYRGDVGEPGNSGRDGYEITDNIK